MVCVCVCVCVCVLVCECVFCARVHAFDYYQKYMAGVGSSNCCKQQAARHPSPSEMSRATLGAEDSSKTGDAELVGPNLWTIYKYVDELWSVPREQSCVLVQHTDYRNETLARFSCEACKVLRSSSAIPIVNTPPRRWNFGAVAHLLCQSRKTARLLVQWR